MVAFRLKTLSYEIKRILVGYCRRSFDYEKRNHPGGKNFPVMI